ncbi:MAG: adenosine kinase, partial [Alphaproteobacteria bacterium]|nr:adenosine kinase [Alphaproteobacteria bacterium]
GIGNAIVDIIAQAEDDFLRREDIHKGSMTLIDADRAKQLFEKMGPTTTVSGGSAANTVAGIAGLGGKAAYIGKVFKDHLGGGFAHDMKALGIHYPTPAAETGAPTACCIILVTPDGQRSMNTFLGASTDFSVGDVDEASIAASQVVYLEGYLFDKPPAKEAFYQAVRLAKKHGRKVALSLSDGFCVDRHRADFHSLLKEGVDILFANEVEATALFQKNSLEESLASIAAAAPIAVVTRSEKGALVLSKGQTYKVAIEPVAKVVDTTGAGDSYAAGFLYGLTHGFDLPACGRIAAICAAEIISHIGPRPQTNLKKLLESKMGASFKKAS